jgi:alpha-1,2-glucosyltransferase
MTQKPETNLSSNILKNRKNVFFLLAACTVLLCGFYFVQENPPIADEYCHYKQINGILEGRDLFPKLCPYLPGYHWTMAVLSMLVQSHRGFTMRLLATFLSFLCILSFFSLTKKIDEKSAIPRSLLFLIFPLFFPFFSLVYTDIYSMMFVLLALSFALDQRLWLSGIVGILGLLVRQNNIVWLAMIALMAYAENYYPQYQWKDVKRWISKFIFFFLAAALIVFFVIWNKGFVLGDRSHHILALSSGNLFFMLFLFFFLFAPYNLSNFPKIVDFLKTHKLMGLVLAEVFLVYLFFFKADHIFNHFGRFLHNLILVAMHRTWLSQCLSFLPIAYSIVSLCVTPLKRKSFYLLYPFTVIFLTLDAVIDVRYLFVPLALFLAFKEDDSERITLFTLATYLVPTMFIMALLAEGAYFP